MTSGILPTALLFNKLHRYLRLSDRPSANRQLLKVRFAKEFLRRCNMNVKVTGSAKGLPCPLLIVSNHVSYVDIILLSAYFPKASFVSKAEVQNWPLIGKAAKSIDTVFVKRESNSSRLAARSSITQALTEEKKQIIVFPAGTTTIRPSAHWKNGAFKIAAETGVPILPVRLNYNPLREVAYIDDDTLFFHLIKLIGMSEIETTLEFGDVQQITRPIEQAKSIKEWCEKPLSKIE